VARELFLVFSWGAEIMAAVDLLVPLHIYFHRLKSLGRKCLLVGRLADRHAPHGTVATVKKRVSPGPFFQVIFVLAHSPLRLGIAESVEDVGINFALACRGQQATRPPQWWVVFLSFPTHRTSTPCVTIAAPWSGERPRLPRDVPSPERAQLFPYPLGP